MGAQVDAGIRRKLSDALRRAIENPGVQQRLNAQYIEPVGDSPEQVQVDVKDEVARWAPLIEQLELKASN